MSLGTTHKWAGIGAFAITPDDNTDLSLLARGIYVGTSGDLKVTMADNTTVTFGSIAAGVVHPIAVKRVWSTGTSASGIKGLV